MPLAENHPGDPVDEILGFSPSVQGVLTAITAFVGRAGQGPLESATSIASFSEFERIFGGLQAGCALGYAVRDFFRNGGRDAIIVRLHALTKDHFLPARTGRERRGLHVLDAVDLFNLLCIPAEKEGIDAEVIAAAAAYCERRRALLLLDPPPGWHSAAAAIAGIGQFGTRSENAAVFFPMLRYPDPMRGGQPGDFAPCGAVAGIFARTDAQRGVWKAPAGFDATFADGVALNVALTDTENGRLGPLGINCLRSMPRVGSIVWGARTLRRDDGQASAWNFIPVRRTALFIEESIERGLRSMRGEAGDAALWERMRLAAAAFMHSLFLQGAFQGRTPQEAYFVRCGPATMTEEDIESGVVNMIVGFAPVKTGEFVEIRISWKGGWAPRAHEAFPGLRLDTRPPALN